jgi:hypothetical protein
MSNQAKEYDELALVTLSLWYESRKTSLGYLISDNFLCTLMNKSIVKVIEFYKKTCFFLYFYTRQIQQ